MNSEPDTIPPQNEPQAGIRATCLFGPPSIVFLYFQILWRASLNHTNRNAMPTVETDRLCLRMLHPDDLDSLAALVSDPEVMKFVGNGLPATRAEAEHALHSIIRHWGSHGFGRWAVIDKATQAFAGFGGLRSLLDTPEVVYHFASAYWGRGLATELARASLRFGFEEHQFDRIIGIAKPENMASIHVMKKLGMRYDMQTTYYNIDVVQYHISRAQFKVDDSTYIVKRDNAG